MLLLTLIRILYFHFSDAKAGTNEEKGWGNSAYVVSKVGVNALTFIQHRKFTEDPRADIVINAVRFYLFILIFTVVLNPINNLEDHYFA